MTKGLPMYIVNVNQINHYNTMRYLFVPQNYSSSSPELYFFKTGLGPTTKSPLSGRWSHDCGKLEVPGFKGKPDSGSELFLKEDSQITTLLLPTTGSSVFSSSEGQKW